MLRDIAVVGRVLGPGEPDAGGDAAAGFVGLRACHHAEGDFAGAQGGDTAGAGDQLAARRQNRRHHDEVLLFDICVTQCIFKGGQSVAMHADAARKEYRFGNRKHGSAPPVRDFVRQADGPAADALSFAAAAAGKPKEQGFPEILGTASVLQATDGHVRCGIRSLSTAWDCAHFKAEASFDHAQSPLPQPCACGFTPEPRPVATAGAFLCDSRSRSGCVESRISRVRKRRLHGPSWRNIGERRRAHRHRRRCARRPKPADNHKCPALRLCTPYLILALSAAARLT